MSVNDSIDDLPSANRPMNPEFFAVSKEYGIPADGSVATINNGDTLIYKDGEWALAFLPMPVKGDLIMLEGKQYRVLKIDDTVAEVLAMYDASTSVAFDASGNSKVYANNSLDTYCNETFYNSLSMTMKNTIVAKTFQQDSWYYAPRVGDTSGNPKYIGHSLNGSVDYEVSLGPATFGTNISRKCYVLSIQDIIDYLEVIPSMTTTDTTLTDENVWKMFWNQATRPGSVYPWLRSADSDFKTAFYIDGMSGEPISGSINNSRNVRPAFQIDLSKVDWVRSE